MLKQHLYLTPYPEDDVEALVATMGDDHVLFGSDYPHPEGLAEPSAFAALIANLDDGATRRVMRDNTCRLLGLATGN